MKFLQKPLSRNVANEVIAGTGFICPPPRIVSHKTNKTKPFFGSLLLVRPINKMPSYAPRDLEPYKRKEIVVKREWQLTLALKTGASKDKLIRAAENLRKAQLLLAKSKYDIVTQRIPSTINQTIENIESEKKRWLTLSSEEIIEEYRQK